MQTKLVVASGKSAGRAIAIKRSTLLIGRAEDCDVRPLSEDVSRRHCAIHVGPADVWAEDLGSRNGTFVNNVRIKEKTRLSDGDMVRVGSLELKVSCAKPAAPAGSEEDVSKWLMADDAPAGMFDTTQTLRVPGASKEDSSSLDASNIHSASPTEGAGSGVTQSGISSKSSSNLAIEAVKESQAKPGMLPVAKKSSDSSRDAAAEALRKFFNNR